MADKIVVLTKNFLMIAGIVILAVALQATDVDACTSFCLDTPDGPVFGSNVDLFIPGDGLVFINQRGRMKTGFAESTAGTTAKWVATYGSVTFNLAGREWAWGGMNEAGLALGAMELLASRFPDPDERPPLPIGPWAQYILDTCGNIDDVINAIKIVRMEDAAPPVHYLISDAKGETIVVEWFDGKRFYKTGKSLPVKALSNSPYHEALAVYQRGGPGWWESDRGETNQRFADAAKRNAAYKFSNEPNAIKYAFETLTHVVAAAHTKWNVVFNIPKREIYFRSAASPTLKYLFFKELDFSCAAQPLMLDINTPLEGNVSKSFRTYDSAVNLSVLQTLCARYGINITRQDAEDLVRQIESFECLQ